ALRGLMSRAGFGGGDFAFRRIEGTSGRWACLRRGDCDAVVLGQPQDLIAVEQGLRMLGTPTEEVPDLLYTVTAVRPSWATANKEAVVRYVRALSAAFTFIRDPPHRDRVVSTAMQRTNASDTLAHDT